MLFLHYDVYECDAIWDVWIERLTAQNLNKHQEMQSFILY